MATAGADIMEKAKTHQEMRQRVCHAEALRKRMLRRWISTGLRRLRTALAALRAEAELRAMDAHELHDLGLDRSGIGYAARHGREG
jgi:uncharacterized protein YjiS (DUF1127 family)